MSDIQSAALWIGRLLVEEARYLSKVEDQVKELQNELEWMQCFLREADAKQFDNAMARKWVAQIREFAYEAEDMIERYLVRVVPRTRGRRDFYSLLKTYSLVVSKIASVHMIGNKIDDLKQKMSALSSKLQTYGINLGMDKSSSFALSQFRRGSYYVPSEEKSRETIGRDSQIQELVTKLVSKESQPAFAVCGEGGVGKTFVAEKIFNHPIIRKEFDAFAWANISKPCRISYVQQELLSSLTRKSIEQTDQMTDDELKDGLYKALRKRKSFIVLDGIWDKEVWNSLKVAFPISKDFRSKLLLTTREDKLARHVDQDVAIHKLEPLNRCDSTLLLQEKIGNVMADKCCLQDDAARIGELQRKLLVHCRGLPLPIVLLGGVLATKKTLEEWESVHQSIKSYSTDHHNEQSWKRILELSYYDLPFQLKPCFLYLGYFPTNLEISTRKITQLWEAEGLVPSGDDETYEEVVQDEIAELCLSELVERSLVQVGSRGLQQKAKTCQMHDIIQQLCISKATKVNWLNIVQLGVDEPDQDQSSTSVSFSSKAPKSSTSAKRKYRRLAIYCSNTLDKLPSDYRHAKFIRSLLFFNTPKGQEVLIRLEKRALKKAFTDYKLLRVLDIENIEVQSLPHEVGFLIHLRYLSLKGSWVSKLPTSIRDLRCLQTLDLRVLSFVRLRIPDVIHKLGRLIHLYLPTKSFLLQYGAEKLRLKGLHSLETLSNLSNMCQVEDLCKLKSLRKFSSCDVLCEIEKFNFIFDPTSFLSSHLERLSLKLDGTILKNQPHLLENCQKLRKLWLVGEIGVPISYCKFPSKNLIQLLFFESKFPSDPMPVLGELSCLRKLSLEHAAYEGSEMRCLTEGFKELTHLTLDCLDGLEDWTVEQGSMPKLHHLEINRCHKLKMIPDGLEPIKSLQELVISYMPFSFFNHCPPILANLSEQWPDFHKVRDVPCITIAHVMA